MDRRARERAGARSPTAPRPAKPPLLAVILTGGLISATVVAMLPTGAGGTAGPGPGPASAAVVRLTATGLSVDVSLAAPRVLERLTRAGPCQALHFGPAQGQAGGVALEQVSFGWLLGVPAPGAADIESLQVRERRYGLARPCPPATPAPRLVQELDDRRVTVPGWHPSLPSRAITLTDAGWLHGQPIMRLGVQPGRRIDSSTLAVLEGAKVRIRYRSTWRPQASPGGALADPFATIFRRVLLNPEWAPASAPSPPGAAREAAPSAAHHGRPAAAADPEALKLIVATDGPVSVRGADLAAAGWPLAAVDPTQLAMTSGGRPHALHLEGIADGRLDADDRLIFHGRAMTSEYTADNVYWLTAEGDGPRFAERSAAPDRGWPIATWHPAVARFERDTVYYLSMHWRDGDDRWMWGRALAPGERITHNLEVGSLAAGSPAVASLHVTLQGCTDDAQVFPDHRAHVWLNDASLGQTPFDGLGTHRATFELPGGVLREGMNRFVIASEQVPGTLVNQFYLNRIELEYAAGFRASADRLRFAAPGAGRFEFRLEGFSHPDIVVDDVTDPAEPVRLLGTQASRDDDNRFSLRFASVTDAATKFEAYVPAKAEPPQRIAANEPSNWRTSDHGADYIVISHAAFIPELGPLVAHRRSQGMRVAVVNVDDVYDEFSHGIFDPRAIREFLRFASGHWQPPMPAYALLVGEANLDYRRGYNVGPPNFVPQMQVNLDAGPAGSSDTWFAMLDDDALPDMLLGRISVSRAAELRPVVAKILGYEHGDDDAWRRSSIWVADDEAPFETLSDDLAALLNPSFRLHRFYAARFPRDQDLTAAILAAIEDGAGLVGYAGHGNVDTWGPWPGGGRILQNRDIARLANGHRLPILVAATCMNGWVSHPNRPVSLGELWLTHPAGAGIAAWASSGLEPLPAEAALLRPFVAGLAENQGLTIGGLTLVAMAHAWANDPRIADTLRQYTLLGDPALRIVGPPSATGTPQADRDPKIGRCYLPALAKP